jgi:Dihaem cytochrome c
MNRTMLMLAALAAGGLFATGAAANGRVPAIADAVVIKECGACHFAYQPQFLPKAAWRKIMATLDDHFGDNASLPEATRGRIEAYLVANAGGGGAAQPLRITELDRFKHQHRKVSQADWTKAKSKANCEACHNDAAKGRFEDD